MTKEQVDDMLRRYRFEAGNSAFLDIKVRDIEKQIAQIREMSVLDVASLQSPVISDMPRGTKMGNPTERAGMMLAEGITVPEIEELQVQLDELRKKRDASKHIAECVESWLRCLSEQEKFVIEGQLIDGKTWYILCGSYRAKFGTTASKDTLRRIKISGMKKIYQIAK